MAAFATLVAAPLVAGALTTGHARGAARACPAESIAVVLILLAFPAGWLRWVVAAVFGVFVVSRRVVAALDLGFEATDRPRVQRHRGLAGDRQRVRRRQRCDGISATRS